MDRNPNELGLRTVAAARTMPVMTRRGWTLAGVLVATFMLLVDITIVNVALPSLQRDLHAQLSELQWVVDAYAVALAGMTLATGALADRWGRRLVFATGVGVFTVASLACGLAQTPLILELARGVQGIGGAAMFATSLALIAQEFEGPARGSAIALWGATVGGAVAIGPLMGGIVVEWLDWRWIFFVNVPIGAFALLVAVARMGEARPGSAGRLDVGGLVTFSAALFLLTYGLVRGNASGWTSGPIVGSLVGAALLLAAFVLVELRHPNPTFDLSLFRRPAFGGVSLAVLALAAGMFANFFFLALYLQDLLGYSPLQAGLRTLPATGFVFLTPLVLRRLGVAVFGWIPVAVGLALVTGGLYALHTVGPSARWTALLPGLVLCGLGIGLANPAIASGALAVVEPARAGMASGINNTLRMTGVATGIAALGVVFQHRIAAGLGDRTALAQTVAATGTQRLRADATAFDAARAALVHGFDDVLLAGAAIALVGLLAAVVLMRPRRGRAPEAEAVTDTAS
jgi:EmrB/QacA subfamily drug resistance transporter